MREIKFRYVFRNKIFGDFSFYYLTLKEIEEGAVTQILNSGMTENGYKLVSRDKYTGLEDKNKKEIYEEDILQYPNKNLLVLIKFGKYDNGESYEDNISGYGYYLEIKDKFTKEKRIEDLAYCNDVLDILKIIGNTHKNPELLEKKVKI